MHRFEPSYAANPKQIGQIARHVRASVHRPFERLKMHRQQNGVFAVVGGGPSIANHLSRLREIKADPANRIVCVNRAHGWLIENDIVPSYCVLFEVASDPRLLEQTPHEDVTYLIASQCHDSAFDHFKDAKCLMWHAFAEAGENEILAEAEPGALIVGGGSTSALRCLNIGLVLGHRKFEGFGLDSSFNGTSHVYHDEVPDYAKPGEMDIFFERQRFHTSHYLARQAHEFSAFCKIHHEMFDMKIHGDGLLPAIHRRCYPQFYEGEDHAS